MKAQPVEAPWEKAPFTGDGKALHEAAQQVKATEGEGATVLFEEAHYSLDSKGRCDTVTHMVYRIETEGAVEGWSTLQALWEPWHLERPQMRARVITSDGVEHALDASTIGEFADKQSEGDLFDDRKFLRAQLPAVAPGAIVETEVVTHESTPAFDRGVVKYFYVGAGVTTDRTRLVLDAPSSLPLRYVTRLLQPAQPEKREENGSVRLEFNFGRQEAIEQEGLIAPSDIAQVPYLAFATGKSWAEVAGRLAEVLEEKIDVESVRKIAQEATLKRKYGDCKDQSTLMVAMLRALKIPAHVVALDTGPAWTSKPRCLGSASLTTPLFTCPAHRRCGSILLPTSPASASCRFKIGDDWRLWLRRKLASSFQPQCPPRRTTFLSKPVKSSCLKKATRAWLRRPKFEDRLNSPFGAVIATTQEKISRKC